jgi:hypothetical protein
MLLNFYANIHSEEKVKFVAKEGGNIWVQVISLLPKFMVLGNLYRLYKR